MSAVICVSGLVREESVCDEQVHWWDGAEHWRVWVDGDGRAVLLEGQRIDDEEIREAWEATP